MGEHFLKQAWMLAIEAMSWTELREVGVSTALAKATGQLGIRNSRTIAVANRLVRETLHRKNFIDKVIESVLAPSSCDDFVLGVQSFLRLFTYKTKFVEGSEREAIDIANVGRSILGWRTIKPVEEALGKILALNLDAVLANMGDDERISLQTFHPRWFVDYCMRLMGREETLKLLEKNLETPPTYIRLNTLKEDERNILNTLSASGVVLEEVENMRFLYKVVKKGVPLIKLKLYEEGLFFIEDRASCLPVEVGDPKPGFVVLDVCAAPGAKTTHMAQLMQNRGEIISIDYSPRRVEVLERELQRMGVEVVDVIVCDAHKPLPVNVEVDLVMLDPPCSGTGSFWRMPSLKWRVDINMIENLARIQWMMLKTCAEHVKKGGSLIYSTSSITLEENEILIERFLEARPEFSLAETEPKIGVPALRGQGKCQRTYPHIHEANGSYIAKLVRN